MNALTQQSTPSSGNWLKLSLNSSDHARKNSHLSNKTFSVQNRFHERAPVAATMKVSWKSIIEFLNEWLQSRGKALIVSSLITICLITLMVSLIDTNSYMVYPTLFLFLCYNGTDQMREVFHALNLFLPIGFFYEAIKILLNYKIRPVLVEELYLLDKQIFGFQYRDEHITFNEFLLLHHNPLLTFISGIIYLSWASMPLGFGLHLYSKKSSRRYYYEFAYNYLLLNLVGFSIYYIFPAAPPWFYQKFAPHLGTNCTKLVPSMHSASLVELDDLIGIPVFRIIYSFGDNIFAAVPSMHVAYPCHVFFYTVRANCNFLTCLIFFICSITMSFAAIYTSHHYLIDVLLGVLTACFSFAIFQILLSLIRNKKRN